MNLHPEIADQMMEASTNWFELHPGLFLGAFTTLVVILGFLFLYWAIKKIDEK